MAESYIQSLFAERLGGEKFGKDTKIYKFEKIKRAKRAAKEISKIKHDKEKIVIIGKTEEKVRTLPKTSAVCPKCGHSEAFYWLVQTRGADESSTQFFRCTRCSSTWRETS